MPHLFKQNATSVKVRVFIRNSTSASGAGLSGLAYNAAGLTAYYYVEGAGASTPLSLVSAVLGTWTSSGFVVVDNTNMPGLYELSLPNACFADLGSLHVVLQGATDMAETVLDIQVVAFDPNDANALGLAYVGAINTQAAKLLFDGSSYVKSDPQTPVTVTGTVTVGGYAASMDPGTYVLATPANKLVTDASGRVLLQPTGLDAITIETGINCRQAIALCSSALVGVLSGAAGPSVAIAAMNAPSTPRIVASVDALGDRTAVTLTPPT